MVEEMMEQLGLLEREREIRWRSRGGRREVVGG